eukprot:TRINITY_DN8529_c0_g1_i1.p2 TRINITY_DN8529_c0_g1~~TRINITY_DN8529_c0_g1_i1.p2  ORF type:complete len:203 (+),score=31.45 TRINITY_DN8529_c0_g1_i1:95-703(+)
MSGLLINLNQFIERDFFEEKDYHEKSWYQQQTQYFPQELILKIFPIVRGPQNIFRALVQGHHILSGYEAMPEHEEFYQAQELRQQILDVMQKEIKFYSKKIQEKFEKYVARMRDQNTPASELEIITATEVLKRAIKIYKTSEKNQDEQCLVTFGEKYEFNEQSQQQFQNSFFKNQCFFESNEALQLICHDGHYDLLLVVGSN